LTAGTVPRPELWTLPDATWPRLLVTFRRALARSCPYCGSGNIFSGYLSLREWCPRCGVRFEREDGYFLGAYALNLIGAEFIGLGLALFLIFGTPLRDLDLLWQEIIAVTLAVALPVVFFPFSRTLWMAMDLVFHPPGRAVSRPASTTARRPEL
jgi:uncharacterized protein (DUF983 family)